MTLVYKVLSGVFHWIANLSSNLWLRFAQKEKDTKNKKEWKDGYKRG